MSETYDGFDQEVTDDDLAAFDEDFAQARIDDLDGPPDGRYVARVESARLTRSRAGSPLLRWELTIVSPTSVGSRIFRNNMWASEANVRWLKRDLHVCGVDLDKLSDLPRRLPDLLDVVLEVSVRTKDDNRNVRLIRQVEAPPEASEDALGTF